MSPRSTQEEHVAKLKAQLAEATAKIEAKRQAAIAKLRDMIESRRTRMAERQAAFEKRIEQMTNTHYEWVAKQDEELIDLLKQLDELTDPTPDDDESTDEVLFEADTSDDNTVA